MADDGTIFIEGAAYTPDDLTFREQREMRDIYRNMMGDPAADLANAANMDFLPVLAYLVRRRDDPEYTLERALDLKIADLVTPPPTKPKRAAR